MLQVRDEAQNFMARFKSVDHSNMAAGLSNAEREANYLLRRAADHRREAKIARAEGDETTAVMFDVGADRFEKLANELRKGRLPLRDVWAPRPITGESQMTVKNHLVVLKLATICDAVMKPDVAKVWPEQNEEDFHLTAAGKVRHNGDDLKVKKFINTVVRNEMPSIFLAVGEPNAGGKITTKNNPWSREGWSVTRQGDVTKSLGIVKASQIASAAGSFVGATKPGTTKRLGQTYERGADGKPQRIAS